MTWLVISIGLLVGQTPPHVEVAHAPAQLVSELSVLLDKGELGSAKPRVDKRSVDIRRTRLCTTSPV